MNEKTLDIVLNKQEKEDIHENMELVKRTTNYKDSEAFKNIKTVDEKPSSCEISNPCVENLKTYCNVGLSNENQRLCEMYNAYIVNLNFCIYSSLDFVEFEIILKNKRCIVKDIYPREVTGEDILRNLKIGINDVSLGFKLNTEKVIYEYSELHPTIKSFLNTRIFWRYKNKNLEGQKYMHIVLLVPKDIESEVTADLLLKDNDSKCLAFEKNSNLLRECNKPKNNI